MSFPQSDSAPPARTDATPKPSNANPAYTTRDGNSMPATFANAADPLDDCVATVCCAADELPALPVLEPAPALPLVTAALPLAVPDVDADAAPTLVAEPVVVTLETGVRTVTPCQRAPRSRQDA
ncbi:hypothetical protein LTS09_011341 [Friedmanniomyces endolithicus]|nr:hypothetical protein LTS09_011341 [Friedmanniomyces endolithicus]